MVFKVFAGNMYVGTLFWYQEHRKWFQTRHRVPQPYWFIKKYKKLNLVGPKLQYYRNLKVPV